MTADAESGGDCSHCGELLSAGVYRCESCARPTGRGTVRTVGGYSLTLLEQAAIAGSALALLGLLLPLSRIGPALIVLAPVNVFVIVLVVGTVAASVVVTRPVTRMAALLVFGGCLAVLGVVLFLGLSLVGLGVWALLLGGIVIASVGYTDYSRYRSFTRALVVGWLSTLSIMTVLFVAI